MLNKNYKLSRLYGFDPEEASREAQIAWRLLTPRERLVTSRLNPFRLRRKRMIRALSKQEGLTQIVLAEISGLSPRTIANYCGRGGRDE